MRGLAVLAMGIAVTSATARAEPQQPPPFRASVTYGIAARGIQNNHPFTVPLNIDGVSASVFHAAGAYFFLPWLGAAVDASFEWFQITGDDLAMRRVDQRLFGFRMIGELVGRWSPRSFIGVELHLGFAGGQWPGVAVSGTTVRPQPVDWLGPSIGFALALEPEGFIGGQLYGRFTPAVGGSGPLKPSSLSAGLQVHVGNFGLGQLRLSPVLELELIGAGASADDGRPEQQSYKNLQLRGALGLRVRYQPAAPVEVVGGGPNAGGESRIRGRVVTGGIGLAGVSITSATLSGTATSDANGDFVLEAVPAGKHTLKALLAGYKPLEQVVEVAAGDEAVVTLALLKPTGPGKLRGVVKGEKDAALAGAEVVVEGQPAVKTAADGTYSIESAGPGPVKVTVKLKGYQPAEDAAQVPPEGVAQLDFTLVKQGVAVPATIRGSVRAASGKVVKATVKISDVNLTIPIKGDGRFVVQVPGGKYTLTIEGPGYVTQVKTVEVADGDQAIFHCDLQPTGR